MVGGTVSLREMGEKQQTRFHSCTDGTATQECVPKLGNCTRRTTCGGYDAGLVEQSFKSGDTEGTGAKALAHECSPGSCEASKIAAEVHYLYRQTFSCCMKFSHTRLTKEGSKDGKAGSEKTTGKQQEEERSSN